MKPVTAYQTDDGKTFSTEGQALKHEAEGKVHSWADRVGIGRGGEWGADMVVDAMLKDAKELAALLNQYNSS